jgi:hypothetical protein
VIVVLLCDVSLLYSSVASAGLVRDPDIWGHFRTGQWIFSHGQMPITDPFSAYGMENLGLVIAGFLRSL